MKKITFVFCSLFFIPALAQEHFGPITTSKRVGILNGNMNPSEFANLDSKFEVQLFGLSLNSSNNRVSIGDLSGDENIEDLIFSGSEGVDFSTNFELALPGFAFKALGFGFAISSGAHIQANVNDVDPVLGRALSGEDITPTSGLQILDYNTNQRMNGTAWGEIGFSVSRKIWANKKHRFNAGVTMKLLFPGSYGNVGMDDIEGTLSNNEDGDVILSDATGKLNIAYSGSLGQSFEETENYTNSLFGGLNGFAGDIGFDYQWKPGASYKLKVGVSIKNMGSMTFKDDNNSSTNYELQVGSGANSLNLSDLDNISGLEDIEDELLSQGVIAVTPGETDFKVKLPTVFNLYADLKVVSKFNVTLFFQQKMNDNSKNNQINAQNIFSVTPRVNLAFFEAFLPVSVTEIAGTNAGFGFRLSGFYLGSNSVFTALASGKQADAYFGYRFGFL
jgi:hypothetical protein